MQIPEMHLTSIDGVDLDLHDSGEGEPIVFVHGGTGDECFGILNQSVLNRKFRLIHYHRRGWGRSSGEGLPLTIEEQAADCKAVMDHLGVERAHFVGLSIGGAIVLQFAVEHPEAVHSLAVAEPSLKLDAIDHAELAAARSTAGALYLSGDKAGALRTVFSVICGPGFEEVYDRNLPEGWFERLIDDADTLFQHDARAMSDWEFGPVQAARLTHPLLNLTGEHSSAWHRAVHTTVQEWIPHAESAIIPGSTHCMFGLKPAESAQCIADFVSRHSMN